MKDTIINDYWLNKLNNVQKSILNDFIDVTDSILHKRKTLQLEIPQPSVNELFTITKNSDLGLFVLLVTGLKVLINRYFGSSDITIGTLGLQKGPSNDILFCRSVITDDDTLKELVNKVKSDVLETFNYGNISFSMLKEKLQIQDQSSLKNMFDVALVFQPLQHITEDLDKFDIVIKCISEKGKLVVSIDFTTVFTLDIMESFAQNYICFFNDFKSKLDQKISSINIVNKNELFMLHEFNNINSKTIMKESIIDLFENNVKKHPESIAVTDGKEKITYQGLSLKSTIFASKLIEKGFRKNQIAGILIDRSIEMVVCMIAVLKAGGTFLPIDPDYPEERIKHILKDSNCSKILTRKIFENKIEGFELENVLLIDEIESTNFADANFENLISDNAYVLYTSGSTGKPKAAIIGNESLLNLCNWYIDTHQINDSSNVLLLIPFTFDASIKNIIAPLISGAKIVLAPSGPYNPYAINDVIKNHQVTHINCVPSSIYPVLDISKETEYKDLASVKYLALGGESMNISKLTYWWDKNSQLNISNIYGPTECTDISTFYFLEKNIKYDKNIPIGKPIYNAEIYVLNAGFQLQPAGVPGEIFIGGIGVGKGYLNNELLTSQKFSRSFIEGKYLYRTGDVGKWLPNGNVEFLGRKDFQVKIRGNRIEIEEIEKQMYAFDGILSAVVGVKENDNLGKYLCGYYVAEGKIDNSKLRNHLENFLPKYMVPQFYMQLSTLPLTSHGKLDRKSLPDIKIENQINATYIAPKTDIEVKIVEIWKEVLGLERIGVNDNFFDIGGNSLTIVVIGKKINELLNIEVSPVTLFNYPTIQSFVSNIDKNEKIDTEKENNRKEAINTGKNLMKNQLLKSKF
jgi:amino acid adenylation domain-containing protein